MRPSRTVVSSAAVRRERRDAPADSPGRPAAAGTRSRLAARSAPPRASGPERRRDSSSTGPFGVRGLRSSLPPVLALVLLAWSVSAQAPSDRARAEDQARRASDRLEALKQEADRLASEERTLLTELRRLELDQAMKAQQVAKVTAERDQAARDVA